MLGDLFYDACEDLSGTVQVTDDDDDDDNLCNDILTVENSSVHSLDTNFEDYSETSSCVSEDHTVEATQYRDVLIYFRFNDPNLPFKFREVIIFDRRLLTLLEAGLPSWVIFLQSYPVFCNFYRPWMCPLARVLYVIISLVTVLIGLYDLYKNVPVLKATASHLCGPFFDWIENWDMLSRVKYLGTMLFLHNFQKAFKWCLALANTAQSFFSVLVQPLVIPLVKLFEFLLPSLNILFIVVGSIFYFVWDVIETACNMVGILLELLFLPLWFIFTLVWRIGTSIVYPIFWISREILYAPIRLLLAMYNFVVLISTCTSDIVGDTWHFVSSIFQLASSSSEVTVVSTNEVSMWRALWNDLFSQIFRALRVILNGFLDFVAAWVKDMKLLGRNSDTDT
ncbi:uncharacterized protein G2W53_029236 [Senna tora]|uniref:Uncharacterized protein n=1 Tax=Senna tora TaxID=362788 RepID=A0A834T7B3_9FABA|nr:uncharacterized protein G2W53_029236 [Senna tora]